jgi:phosphatidylserine decarboxylase
MSNPQPLPVWDRKNGRLIQEFMTDSAATYESRPHRSLTNLLQSHPAYDWLISLYQNTRLSARKIEPFIRKHKIDMGEFEPGPYSTYAEFFDRRFRPGARTFPKEPRIAGAFAEARYFGWTMVTPDQNFPIKGYALDANELLGSAEHARLFKGGSVILARLSPSITTTCIISMLGPQLSTKALARDCGRSTKMHFKTTIKFSFETSERCNSFRPRILA